MMVSLPIDLFVNMATASDGDKVVIPTDQPLLAKEVDGEELENENEFDSKDVALSEGLPNSSKGLENRKSHSSYGIPMKEKTSVVPSVSLGIGETRNKIPNQTEYTLAKSQSEIQVCVTNSLSVSQTSKNSLMTFSSSGTFYDHSTNKKKTVDLRITPKRVAHLNGKEITDFRQMEQGLLQLLEDFHSGKLEAFGQDCTFEKMENVREQQERLARLHFDLNAQQELCGQHTDEGIKMAKGNLSKLMENLQQLSLSIEQLQSANLGIQANT